MIHIRLLKIWIMKETYIKNKKLFTLKFFASPVI